MTVTLTREAWKTFAPKCPTAYTEALFSHLDLLAEAGLFETELRWCHFAATVYAETGGFTSIRESLRYTKCETLRKTWPSRFRHKTDDELRPLLKNDVHLADVVYGCYSGRKVEEIGDVKPGEAFGYRGGGWFQTTHKPAVAAYCAKLGVTPSPKSLDDPVLTLKFAVIEWTEGGCNAYADANEIRKVAKVINTGSATNNIEPVGMDHRKAAFARAWKQWGEHGDADVPAKPGLTAKAVLAGSAAVAATVETTKQAADVVKPLIPENVTDAKVLVDQGVMLKDTVKTAGSIGSELWANWPLALVILACIGALLWLRKGKSHAESN